MPDLSYAIYRNSDVKLLYESSLRRSAAMALSSKTVVGNSILIGR